MELAFTLPGAAIVVLTLADVYLTVLKGGSTSLISARFASTVWRAFRLLGLRSGRRRDNVLAYAGPTIVAGIVVTWALLLVVGFALIYLPALGTSIRMSEGDTPENVATALYFSAMSLSTLGTGDIRPVTDMYRLVSVAQALIGFSVLTVTITYLLSVYSALDRHNSLALALHHATGDSDSSAEWIARLGSGGDFHGSRQELSNLGTGLMEMIAAHRTYLVLRYFRLSNPIYGLPHIAFLTMDAATLMRTAIDQQRYRSVIESTGMGQVWGGGMQLLTELGGAFLPQGLPEDHGPDPATVKRWRCHYQHMVDYLRGSDVATRPDASDGEERYIALRQEWQPLVSAFADWLGYSWDQIAPADAQEASPKR